MLESQWRELFSKWMEFFVILTVERTTNVREMTASHTLTQLFFCSSHLLDTLLSYRMVGYAFSHPEIMYLYCIVFLFHSTIWDFHTSTYPIHDSKRQNVWILRAWKDDAEEQQCCVCTCQENEISIWNST